SSRHAAIERYAVSCVACEHRVTVYERPPECMRSCQDASACCAQLPTRLPSRPDEASGGQTPGAPMLRRRNAARPRGGPRGGDDTVLRNRPEGTMVTGNVEQVRDAVGHARRLWSRAHRLIRGEDRLI